MLNGDVARSGGAAGDGTMSNPEGKGSPPITRVMIVDDEPVAAEVLLRLLVKEGYHGDVFHDGQAALDALPGVRPHVVLLDVNMPGLSGIDVCRRLKQDPADWLTPVVMVTGQANGSPGSKGLKPALTTSSPSRSTGRN